MPNHMSSCGFRKWLTNRLAALSGVLFSLTLLGGCTALVSGTKSSNPGPAPFTLTSLAVVQVTTSSGTISWQTSAAANSQVDYGTTTSYGSTTTLDSTMVTSHKESLTNLKPGTTYHFRARSTDASNQQAVSADMILTTPAAPDTTPPTVSITSPTANATLQGTVNVVITASDNVGVAGVQLKVDSANSGAEVTASPYVVALNTTTLSNANHVLTAVARDQAGNTATSAAVTVKVNNSVPDTTPPSVSITSPASGATVSGTITINATATDNVAVSTVQFKLDGNNLGGADLTAPYSTTLNTTTVSNGNHTLTAVATDTSNNSATSAAVTVNVSNTTDTTPPTVSITSPASGATLSGTVTVTATASDNVGVASVQFQLDGGNLGSLDTTAPYSVSWNTATASNGTHSLRAVAKDAAGNTGTSTAVSVTVNNAAPPPPPSGSSLSALAAQMQPGTFAILNTVGLTDAFLAPGGTSNDIFQFADNASWDPTSHQFLYQGMSHTSPVWKFIAYRESDNSWRYITPDPALQSITVAHAYDHNTLDPATGTQFHRLYNSTSVYTYSVPNNTYGKLTIPMPDKQVSGGLEWFPERKGLVFVDGDWGIWYYNGATWTMVANTNVNQNSALPQFTMGDTSAIAKYNPVTHSVLFGGGGTTSLYSMDSSGNFSTKASAPFGLDPNDSKVAVDPVTGVYLVCGPSQVMWTFDVVKNVWTNTGISVPVSCAASSGGASTVETAISTYGVVMYVAYNGGNPKVYLFKWANSTGTPPPPPPPPPPDTTPPTVSLTAPASGATVSGNVTVSATASDNVGVAGVQFLLDGSNLGAEVASSPYSISWNTTSASNGAHTLTARARDAAGNTATTNPITVTVSNTVPPPPPPSAETNPWSVRSTGPNVVRVWDFDTPTKNVNGGPGPDDGIFPTCGTTCPATDTTVAADGAGSLKMTIPALSGADTSGSFRLNFSDANSQFNVQFGPGAPSGNEFYVQYRQRFDPFFISHNYAGGDGFKQDIIGEGQLFSAYQQFGTGGEVHSCTNNEVVIVDAQDFFIPQMYHSCNGYDPLQAQVGTNFIKQPGVNGVCETVGGTPNFTGCLPYAANEWMTFEVHVVINEWSCRLCKGTSIVDMWAARDGGEANLLVSFSDMGLQHETSDPLGTGLYGKVWLLPYNTNRDSTVDAGQASATWYDDLIISKSFIPFPTSQVNPPTRLKAKAISSTQIDLTWVSNSTNESGFDIERCQNASNACYENPQMNFVQIATVPAGTTTFSDTTVTSGKNYTYRVRAFRGSANSAYVGSMCWVSGPVCDGGATTP